MIAFHAPARLPPKVRGAYDAAEIPVKRCSGFLCTGNLVLSQPGGLSSVAKPRELQIAVT